MRMVNGDGEKKLVVRVECEGKLQGVLWYLYSQKLFGRVLRAAGFGMGAVAKRTGVKKAAAKIVAHHPVILEKDGRGYSWCLG